ncbi:bifunctional ADP-dependent NAD(P)H-hydrate dehydratase/NAD(P)H-hydrate epimerase [Leisingera sp. ANG-M6]|uniref:bifunctional ADP-dependent NAD(P)H-hydrate dehydratase/NAD(P)H-hydrate epimerase n=1 Tax=Leisingera sp. ANG-M6 TaxID=1577900 RepID=UPI00057E18D3|nr:bifunctional ADP-dependent NAD(P)H-hydrate dehydratase/NAD(P)H-hydrate epimerase [Leisingera sp. ANG-M6]KIC30075.1 hypothetical protein RA24_03825 [Leisingera sp. ANG-M6]
MTELLTAAQMRAIEQAAIASGEVTGLELMERAGQGVVEAIFEEWPELAESVEAGRGASPSRAPEYLEKDEMARRAVVLCGPGNNGGDGFVVARLLKERGWDVEVFLYGDPDKLPPDAKANYERWGKLESIGEWPDAPDSIERLPDVVVDAVFGTGCVRPLGQEVLDVLRCFQQQFIVAVDVLSGVDTDSGKLLHPETFDFEWTAALTVSFHRPKLAHYTGDFLDNDRLKVADIGLPVRAKGKQSVIFGREPATFAVEEVACLSSACPVSKRPVGHKYTHGHALVLSGGHGKTGAARLAARGALRIGAGLVTVGSPRSAMFENAANLTAIMLQQIDGAHGVSELLEDRRFNAVCLGPGLGRGADTQAVVMAVLKENRATVLDADALTRFELKPQALFDLLHENCVLTPHGGEFAKLFPDLAEKLNAPATTGPAYSKVDATREAAKRAGCVVLFKGPDTVIAAPDGRCSVNSAHYERSAPWLATAGSGDVLAGFITGLMARGFGPMQAAETATYIHVECALEFGPGLIAEDLPEQIPAVFRKLGL